MRCLISFPRCLSSVIHAVTITIKNSDVQFEVRVDPAFKNTTVRSCRAFKVITKLETPALHRETVTERHRRQNSGVSAGVSALTRNFILACSRRHGLFVCARGSNHMIFIFVGSHPSPNEAPIATFRR